MLLPWSGRDPTSAPCPFECVVPRFSCCRLAVGFRRGAQPLGGDEVRFLRGRLKRTEPVAQPAEERMGPTFPSRMTDVPLMCR